MNASILRKLSLSVALASPLLLGVGCSENGTMGASKEVSHSETDSTGWFGGRTHEVNTAYKNPDGSTSIETEATTVKGDTTTIVRVKTTTNLDGTVNKTRETRTIVKGTDSVNRETSSIN
jgi:hypothetical protein